MSHANDIDVSHAWETFTYLVNQLNPLKIAYLHCIEGETMGSTTVPSDFSFVELRELFNSSYIANNGYDLQRALHAREKNHADFLCFGRPFIANPDLVARLMTGKALAEAPKDTWYGNGAKGYTDWPVS